MSREGRKRWGINQRFVIGKQDNPMMERWRLLQTPWFGVYIHFIYREDMDPVPHDHPWVFWRMVLRGSYFEHYLTDPASGTVKHRTIERFRPSRFPTHHAHRIVAVAGDTVSVVVVGRKRRSWGFWGPVENQVPREWVDYQDALGLRPTEGVS